MTSPYVLLAKIAAVLIILGALFAGGWHYGAKHIKSAWDLDKAAQTQVLATAQAKTIAAQAASERASQAIAVDYEAKLKDARAAGDALTALVVRYENQLRRGTVPALPRPASGAADTAPLTASNGTPDASAATVDAAAADAISACEADSAQLASLIEWVSTVPR